MKERWPKQVREDLMRLFSAGEECQADIGLIGAVGMEVLTGLPYTGPESELDIIIGRRAARDLGKLSQRLGTGFERHVDAELQLPGIGGVKLGDWMGEGQRVLVKSLDGAALYKKKELMQAGNAFLAGETANL